MDQQGKTQNPVVRKHRVGSSPTSGTSGKEPVLQDFRPGTIVYRYVEIDGNLVHYVDEEAWPTLLFQHPGPAWSFIYRNFIVRLRDRFRCVTLAYPGFGHSSAIEGYGCTLAEHSETVEKFIRRLDLSAVKMMVHDSGGPIGLGVAVRQPELCRAFILTDNFGWALSDHNPSVARMVKLVSGPVLGFFNQAFYLLPWRVANFAARRRKLSR